MAIRKFGTGDGRITGVDEQDPQGISKQAVSGEDEKPWTAQDQEELDEENQR